MEDAQTLSTDVLSEKEAADAILKEKQLRNHKNRVVFRYLFNEQRYVFETVLVGAGIAVSVGSLYGHYYRANPAERIHLLRSHPQLAHYLSKLSIIPPESAEEVPSSQCSLSLSQYANYDYSLFATRLAAAILSDPSHRIASMRSLLDVLDEVFFLFLLPRSGSISPRSPSTRRFLSPSPTSCRFSNRCVPSPTSTLSTSSSLLPAGMSHRASDGSTSAPFPPPSRRKSTTFTSSPGRRTARTAGCIAPTCCPFSNTSNRTTIGSCSDPVCDIRRCWIRSDFIVLGSKKNDFFRGIEPGAGRYDQGITHRVLLAPPIDQYSCLCQPADPVG